MNMMNELSSQIEVITDNGIKIGGISNINQNLEIHYIIYKIVNLVNGKYYIGQHQTKNPFDSYMGSGLLLDYAKEKYGIHNFLKIILFDFDNFSEMDIKETELVQLKDCNYYNNQCYNLKSGGRNFQFSQDTKNKIGQSNAETWNNKSEEEKELVRQIHKDIWKNKSQEDLKIFSDILKNAWKNMPEETYLQFIQKCSENTKGENNPMYGDYNHTKGLRKCASERKGKTVEEIYGEEKGKQFRKQCSENTKGENNPMYKKNPYQGKTKEEIKQIKEKEKRTKENKSPEEKQKTKKLLSEASKRSWESEERRQKQKETIKNRTEEEKEQIKKKQRETRQNWSDEKKKDVHERQSKAAQGENNGMYGKKMIDVMGEEKYNLMRSKQQKTKENRTEEQKRKSAKNSLTKLKEEKI